MMCSDKCYIGIRESDLEYTGDYFDETVTLFSDRPEELPFKIRPNQNIDTKELFPYWLNKALKVETENIKYVFYNQFTAYNFPEHIIDKTICLNSKQLLLMLNNKLESKKWFKQNDIPFIPYETFLGKDITLDILSTHFQGYEAYVVQSCCGGGGIGTFLLNSSNCRRIKEKLQPLQQYIVSPYIKNISVNTHIFISEKDVILSPGSIQIIEFKQDQLCYRGGDFVAYKGIAPILKNRIKELSLQIAEALQKENYKGIAGIDFIIDVDENIFCTEINPRFQASTILINRYLQQQHPNNPQEAMSCFELNEMAFCGRMQSSLNYESIIPYSCYYYYNDELPLTYYQQKYYILQFNGAKVLGDGADYYMKKNAIDKNSYFYRAEFSHAICTPSPDGQLWINDNIKVVAKPTDAFELKVALLNQGIRIESDDINIKSAVYSGIDICILPRDKSNIPLFVNCAYGIHLSQYSPFVVKRMNKTEKLFYYNEELAEVIIEKDQLNNFSISAKRVLYLATDRLRIKLVDGCDNKNMERGCKFCDVPASKEHFSLNQIKTYLYQLKDSGIDFRHILIGGGTNLESDSWDKVIELCEFLKGDEFYTNKPISLMSILPPKDVLSRLKNAGIEEVAFNMEIADEMLAKKLMVAKHAHGKTAYYEIFQEALQIFGQGNVRTALLVGLDKENDLYQEVLTLADMGVLPCLSAFRTLPNSEFSESLNPENSYLVDVYNNIQSLLTESNCAISELGPRCKKCRNNMLIL